MMVKILIGIMMLAICRTAAADDPTPREDSIYPISVINEETPGAEERVPGEDSIYQVSVVNEEAPGADDRTPGEEDESLNAEEEEDDEEGVEVEMVYVPWERATLQGKLKMQGLPLSPNLRIYMVKDSLIDISVRAPLVGEAGRLVLTPDSLTAVNKIGKTYMNESVAEVLSVLGEKGLGIGTVQDILLAQVGIPGIDSADTELDEIVDLYYEEEGQITVVPKGIAAIDGVSYGYVVDETFKPLLLVVMPEGNGNIEVNAEYRYKLQGYDLTLVFKDEKKMMQMLLELKDPEWGGEAPKPLEVNKKYRRVTPAEFMRF